MQSIKNVNHVMLILFLAFPLVLAVSFKFASVYMWLLLFISFFVCSGFSFFTRESIKFDEPSKVIVFALFIFPLASLVTIFFSDNIYDGISKFGRLGTFWLAIPFFLVISSFCNKLENNTLRKVKTYTGYIIILSSIIFFIRAWLEKQAGIGRVGVGLNPILFANIAAVLFLFNFYFFLNSNHKVLRLIYGVCAALMIAALYWSLTRGAWLAVLILPIIYLLLVEKNKKNMMLAIVFSSIAILFFLIAFYVFKDGNFFSSWEKGIKEVFNFYQSAGQTCTSWGARLIMWNNSIELFRDNILFGVGLSNYGDESFILMESNEILLSCSVAYKYTAHSIYFHTLAVSGLLGTLGLALFFYCLIRSVFILEITFRGRWFLLSIIVMYMIFGLSTTWLAKSLAIYIFIFFLFAAYFIVIEEKKH